MSKQHDIKTQIAIIGSGIAGLSSAVFACNRNISAAVVGGPGATDFCSGHIDLLGVFPAQKPRVKSNPWQAIADLNSNFPRHPLNIIDNRDIRNSLQEFLDFLHTQGLEYSGWEKQNAFALTPLGTTKPTYRVPETMWQGIQAHKEKTPCLFLDIYGMKDFDAAGMVSALEDSWPGIRSDCIPFPGLAKEREAYPLLLAQRMENKQCRREMAKTITARLKGEQAVGMPAILGIYTSKSIKQEMEDIIGAKVFEIPTMPSSVPGTRLKETFSNYFDHKQNIHTFMQDRVVRCSILGENDFLLHLAGEKAVQTIRAKSVILASGRYLGQGLTGNRNAIREPLFDLPVSQPENREKWHKTDLFDPEGHPANLAGIETDTCLRPVDAQGLPIYKGLYAVGSVLAHTDWMRFKCGGGTCISTAYRAVDNIKSWIAADNA